eukprot:jgi/Botrbrau1/11489/Bobra.0360s0015.2
MTTKGPKRKLEPPPGQKSISSFFVLKPKEEKKQHPEVLGQAKGETKPQLFQQNPDEGIKVLPLSTDHGFQSAISGIGQPALLAAEQECHSVMKMGNSIAQSYSGVPRVEIVGKRCQIYWPDDDEWYPGTVTNYSDRERKHMIVYDDGEEEWLDMSSERYNISPQGLPHSGRKRSHKHVIESDSEGSVDALVEDAAEEPEKVSPRPRVETKRCSVKGVAMETPDKKDSISCLHQKPHLPPMLKAKISPTTPAPASKKGRFEDAVTPADSLPDKTCPGSNCGQMYNIMQRYATRSADRFPFLDPDRVQDANKHRPGDARYDPRTLYLPPDFHKKYKVSEGQRQWWEFKSKSYDSVMLFKMGKFYEMLEWDAHVGAEVLGLSYMKGEQPHCGFPEARYHENAERLARAGMRVVVVEQTETPEQLRLRNEERRANKQSKVNVVAREIVAVLTLGTLCDPEMLTCQSGANHIMALFESDAATKAGNTCFGTCLVDVATGEMMVGQWVDDDMRTGLRTRIAELRPIEMVIEKGRLSEATRKALRAGLRSPRVNELSHFWTPEQTLQEIEQAGYYSEHREQTASGNDETKPKFFSYLIDHMTECSPSLQALGGCIQFLRDVYLDKTVLPLGRLEPLDGETDLRDRSSMHIHLDGTAYDNLEVLENSNGGTEGTLLANLDHCVTTSGRRCLRAWLCRPLARVSDIHARQDAIQLLLQHPDTVAEARAHLKGVGDLERLLARLNACSGVGHGRDAENVVLYEDAGKRRLLALYTALHALQALKAGLALLRETCQDGSSALLSKLLTPGRLLPHLDPPLLELSNATDWDEAAKTGRVVPKKGISEDFDEAEAAVHKADTDLDSYLGSMRKRIGASIQYIPLHKETHVLEVPEEAKSKVPSNFEVLGQRKGFLRYMSSELRQLVEAREEAVTQREVALQGLLKGILRKFASHKSIWSKAVEAAGQVDALMSLATWAELGSLNGSMCRPTFTSDDDTLVLRAQCLRHPAGDVMHGNFVANDVELGGDAPLFLLLSGPNMGGKSTMLRQICLAALLAHVGAWVPATSFAMSPVDAIFVRMGARDAIMTGQSTFLVELSETAGALRHATARSLIALDELGRGTATTDGTAIAHAVLTWVASRVKCRALFASHYHKLSEACLGNPLISVCHMACHVTTSSDGTEEVTFLYKLSRGSCPKSYGVNVARLAGIPSQVVKRAYTFAADLELGGKFRVCLDGTSVPRPVSISSAVTRHLLSLHSALSEGKAEVLKAAQLEVRDFLNCSNGFMTS